jgi:hypothetical protein
VARSTVIKIFGGIVVAAAVTLGATGCGGSQHSGVDTESPASFKAWAQSQGIPTTPAGWAAEGVNSTGNGPVQHVSQKESNENDLINDGTCDPVTLENTADTSVPDASSFKAISNACSGNYAVAKLTGGGAPAPFCAYYTTWGSHWGVQLPFDGNTDQYDSSLVATLTSTDAGMPPSTFTNLSHKTGCATSSAPAPASAVAPGGGAPTAGGGDSSTCTAQELKSDLTQLDLFAGKSITVTDYACVDHYAEPGGGRHQGDQPGPGCQTLSRGRLIAFGYYPAAR